MKKRIIYILIIISVSFSCKSRKSIYIDENGNASSEKKALRINLNEYLKYYTVCKCIDFNNDANQIKSKDVSHLFMRELTSDFIPYQLDSLIYYHLISSPNVNTNGKRSADFGNKNTFFLNCAFFAESNKMKNTLDSLSTIIHETYLFQKKKRNGLN